MARMVSMVCLFLALVWASGPARAIAVLDLRSGVCHDRFACTLALSGNVPDATLAHLSAPRVSFGTDDFFAYSDGMIFGNSVFPHSFELSFSQNVRWLGGSLELNHGFRGFDVMGPSLDVAGVLASVDTGAFAFASPLVFQANQAYRFQTAPAQSFSFGVLGQLVFSSLDAASNPSVVPIPATLPLLLGVLLAFASLHRLRAWKAASDHGNGSPDHAVA